MKSRSKLQFQAIEMATTPPRMAILKCQIEFKWKINKDLKNLRQDVLSDFLANL